MRISRRTRTLNGYTITKLNSGDYKVSKDEKYLGTYISLSAARYNILQLTSKKEEEAL